MKIRIGSTPGILGAVKNVIPGTPRRVFPGRVIVPRPAPIPHLPPVHFFAETEVQSGAEATLRSEALSNRTGKPVEIHEIRLSSLLGASGFGVTSYVNTGAMTRVRLMVDGKPITNTFVPIWNLGKIENRTSQIIGQGGGTSPPVNSVFVWRLSKPWYVSPGSLVECQFQHSGAIRFPITAKIGLSGKYAANKATTSSVPFAAAYVSKGFDYATILDTDESSERDLVNMTGRTLTVERIIGRAAIVRSTGGEGTNDVLDFDDQAVDDVMLIRMVTSNNLPIIPEFTPIRQVFGYYPSSIDIQHTMSPGDFYRVSARKVAGEALAVPFTTYVVQANISIVGCREESI